MKKGLLLLGLMILALPLMAGPQQILMVVTSCDQLKQPNGTHPTGCWPEELIEPYLLFEDAGFSVTIASPKGGVIPFDQGGLNPKVVGEKAALRYQNLLKQKPVLTVSLPLSSVLQNEVPYDVVFLAGGHGTLEDFFPNSELKTILERAYQNKAIIAGVCHGVVGLLNLKDSHMLKGADLTGFSNKEEDMIGLTPLAQSYLGGRTVAERLKQMVSYAGRGNYTCAEPWQSYVVNYQNHLITGQNPSSSTALAKEILGVLKKLSRNKIKAAIQKGYPVFGSFVTIGHPAVVETLSFTGIDFVWIEGEHAPLSLPQIASLNMATMEKGVVPIVRVPSNNMDSIKQYVDTGAMGIIVPYIKTADDAKKAVNALKYPPLGERGIGLGRATRYFIQFKDYVEHANQDVMVILMLETKEAVANIEEIVAVPGIDLISMGPFDLSASMGLVGQPGHPEVQKALAKVEKVAQKAGIALGISVPDKKTAYEWMERGYRYFVIGADVEYLYKSAKSILDQSIEPDGEWEIAPNLKFHYAYMESNFLAEVQSKTWEIPSIPTFSKEGEPDITNIALKGILGLNFPLPTRANPDDYMFFLKFYRYPSSLDAKITAQKILFPYYLQHMKGWPKIWAYVQNPENIYVKKGLVAKKDSNFAQNPFPALRIPDEYVKLATSQIPAQNLFDTSIPFSSIYFTTEGQKPLVEKESDYVEWTTRGMRSAHRELISIYKKNMIEVKGQESEKFYYFLEPSYAPETALSPSHFTLIKLPKQPMLFLSNYLDLPMPHNLKRIFLSGLLLVYKSQYFTTQTLETILSLSVDSPEFKNAVQLSGSDLLEVVSVVEFEEDKK